MLRKRHRTSVNEQIQDEATEWFIRFCEDEVDGSACAEFDTWLRLSPQHDECTQESDCEPGTGQPPDDLEPAREETSGLGPNRNAGTIGHHAARQHQTRENAKDQELDEKMHQGTASPPIARAEEPGDDHHSRQKKRVGRRR